MARIKLSSMATDLRGKIGGSQVQQTQYGLIASRKGNPINPKAITTQPFRNQFGSIASHWKAFDPATRDEWVAAAPPNLSGYEYYMKINCITVPAGLGFYPPPFDFIRAPVITSFDVEPFPSSVVVTLNGSGFTPYASCFGFVAAQAGFTLVRSVHEVVPIFLLDNGFTYNDDTKMFCSFLINPNLPISVPLYAYFRLRFIEPATGSSVETQNFLATWSF